VPTMPPVDAMHGISDQFVSGLAERASEAEQLRRLPDATVAELAVSGFTELLVAVDPDPVVPDPGAGALAGAVAVLAAAALATVRRWGAAVSGLSVWELAAAVTSGGLLTPTGLVVSINTSCPW